MVLRLGLLVWDTYLCFSLWRTGLGTSLGDVPGAMLEGNPTPRAAARGLFPLDVRKVG